ncbi:MAG: adenosylcobinamide-GDP ribazoletransferase, partial [Bacillota bacterium]
VLLLMPAAGRIGALVGAGASRYAGTSDGPGRWCVEHCGRKEIIAGLALHIIIVAAAASVFTWPVASPSQLGGLSGMNAALPGKLTGLLRTAAGLTPVHALFPAAVIIPPLSSLLLARLLGEKLGGVTGDVLGAICEINQVIFLVTAHLLA